MTDDYQWLEDVDGERSLDWVRARNAVTEQALVADPRFDQIRDRFLAVLEADDRIAYPSSHGDDVLNFWTDTDHRRGILRRCTWDDYLAGHPTWETILDVDALCEAEGESWVFHGALWRRPDRVRALIDLSPGGSDASVTREFDIVDRAFVPESEGGFVRPLAKGGCTWIDDDTVYVTTDFGEGSMTRSGYPRTVRRWRRGTPIEDAEVVFEGEPDDVAVDVSISTVGAHHVFTRALDFYTERNWILRDGSLVEIPIPIDVTVVAHDRWFVFEPRKDWQVGGETFVGGSVVVAPIDGFLDGTHAPTAVFTPSDRRALGSKTMAGAVWTRNHLVMTVLEDVRSTLEVATPRADGSWAIATLQGIPDVWTSDVGVVDAESSDALWLMGNDFLTPPTLFRVEIPAEPSTDLVTVTKLRQSPHRFDATGLAITQHFATSTDDTRIPYFEVGAAARTETTPTLLVGYGGFEIPNIAQYLGSIGAVWLEAGHTFVLANIRGGGEYGPQWHQAGLRENRPRVYEDFEAVARDLIDRGVTTSSQLACSGGSNGGLLVGNMYVRDPSLWGAIVCQVPLLDMQRYHLLLAGASWMAEYGDPDDPDDWGYLEGYSPYHQIDPDADHPPLLLMTSTRDDRVHPGHARKMAAKLLGLGKDVTYYENIEGGHGGAADAAQRATMEALRFTFLLQRLA